MQSFSNKTAWQRTRTQLSEAYAQRIQAGSQILDLTCANPTEQGFVYSDGELSAFWGKGATYHPHALGIPTAREAVAQYLAHRGSHITSDGIWIGSGTSELYAHTMSILCDPGDVWLVPQPGYPLFAYVADLAGVPLSHYALSWDGGWFLDADALETIVSQTQARALVVISPHNPTGHVWTDAERAMVIDCCKRHDLALIVDEVFLDFPVDLETAVTSCAGTQEVLTISLSGASKVAAFPQGKIAWAAVSGPGAEEFLARAELVTDTFLSTSTVIQAGLPHLLEAAEAMQARIRSRCRENVRVARKIVAGTALSVCPVQAGWSMLLRFPQTHDDQKWAMLALESEGIMTHPGYLFGMETVSNNPFLGVSLLLEPALFREGIEKLARLVIGSG